MYRTVQHVVATLHAPIWVALPTLILHGRNVPRVPSTTKLLRNVPSPHRCTAHTTVAMDVERCWSPAALMTVTATSNVGMASRWEMAPVIGITSLMRPYRVVFLTLSTTSAVMVRSMCRCECRCVYRYIVTEKFSINFDCLICICNNHW